MLRHAEQSRIQTNLEVWTELIVQRKRKCSAFRCPSMSCHEVGSISKSFEFCVYHFMFSSNHFVVVVAVYTHRLSVWWIQRRRKETEKNISFNVRVWHVEYGQKVYRSTAIYCIKSVKTGKVYSLLHARFYQLRNRSLLTGNLFSIHVIYYYYEVNMKISDSCTCRLTGCCCCCYLFFFSFLNFAKKHKFPFVVPDSIQQNKMYTFWVHANGRSHNTWENESLKWFSILYICFFHPSSFNIHSFFVHSICLFVFFLNLLCACCFALHQLTERAPVIRALCVLVAGRRRWYPISGVPLLDGGFNIVSRLPLLGALIDALRVFCRPPLCGGVDSYAIFSFSVTFKMSNAWLRLLCTVDC